MVNVPGISIQPSPIANLENPYAGSLEITFGEDWPPQFILTDRQTYNDDAKGFS